MNFLQRPGGIVLLLALAVLPGVRAELIMDDAGRFAVDMGAPYHRSESETSSGLGKTVMHLLTHDGEGTGFVLGYNDYPGGSIAKLNLAETYRNVMNGVLAAMKSEMKSTAEHKLGDITGWEYTMRSADGKIAGHVRSYFVGDRLYQVMYLGPVDTENGQESLHFLNSFRLLH